MITQDQFQRISLVLPVLQHANPPLIREFQQAAILTGIPKGRDVFLEGSQVDSIALLISGVVRVYKIGETGREITLYRFGNGQSCILTANAILSQKTFPAIATAGTFRDWVIRYDLWREFVFDLLSLRLSTVKEVVDDGIMIQVPNNLPSTSAPPHKLRKKGVAVTQVSIENHNTITKKSFYILSKRI